MAAVDRQQDVDLAIGELYAAHARGLVRLAWLLLHDQQEAEEVVQDAFVAVHRRWTGLRDHDAATAYLRRSVVNGARSALRRRGVRERYAAALAAERGPRLVRGPDDVVIAAEESHGVMAALTRLPRRQREVLVLRYYLDLDVAETAAALGITPGSVKTHAHRGLSALRAGWER